MNTLIVVLVVVVDPEVLTVVFVTRVALVVVTVT